MELASSSNVHFLATLLISLTLLIVSISTGAAAARPAAALAGARDITFVRISCGATIYPKLCFSSLSSHASAIRSDPKLLAQAALSVSLDTTVSTSSTMVQLSKSHGLKPREVSAMRDCMEVLSDSVDELRKSLSEMSQLKGTNFELIMSDIQTWVSAALTNEDTCTEGFAGNAMNGGLKTSVRLRILNVAHLTSNALALVNSYASLHG